MTVRTVIASLFFSFSFDACGGGGGDSRDNTPDAINLGDDTDKHFQPNIQIP